jgi:hypothetical protein
VAGPRHEVGDAKCPFEAIGVASGAVGVGFLGYRRQREPEDALARGVDTPLDSRVAGTLALTGAVLAVATILLVLVHPG